MPAAAIAAGADRPACVSSNSPRAIREASATALAWADVYAASANAGKAEARLQRVQRGTKAQRAPSKQSPTSAAATIRRNAATPAPEKPAASSTGLWSRE